jgi:hypothetical protein
MSAKLCNYGSCMEEVGEDGLSIILRRPGPTGYQRAIALLRPIAWSPKTDHRECER